MFLEKILARQFQEVARRKEELPLVQLIEALERTRPIIRPFRQSLMGEGIRIIAEVKQASPSKGLLCRDFNPRKLAESYEKAGASAISVLTEPKFFRGTLSDLQTVKEATIGTPVLRKDFIIDRYQLVEGRLYGADAVLLIVAALESGILRNLIYETIDLGMTPLVEVHNRKELLIALDAGAEVIGINNRNLHTFEVDLKRTLELIPEIPEGITVISESGIKHRQDILELEKAGVEAVLIGEALVTAGDPSAKVKMLFGVD